MVITVDSALRGRWMVARGWVILLAMAMIPRVPFQTRVSTFLGILTAHPVVAVQYSVTD